MVHIVRSIGEQTAEVSRAAISVLEWTDWERLALDSANVFFRSHADGISFLMQTFYGTRDVPRSKGELRKGGPRGIKARAQK